ncbi:hypothetical protein GCM10022389_20680 [Flavobacterium cheonanense]|uniref:GIY-YIG domain-containing protein n=1 Tax=Flavobacterium cheonanense TaxID=706183 RepID=A0ABP7VUR6_9FLAO
MNRKEQIDEFYELIEKLPIRYLKDVKNSDLPEKGVYFFFEDGENRTNLNQKRVVRIGTHAVQANSKATLYKRLKQHSGPNHGYGRHRMSVQRELIGYSIRNKEYSGEYNEWGIRNEKSNKIILIQEKKLEKEVSDYILNMPFIVLKVEGDSSKDNLRAYIESNSIKLLSNYCKTPVDPPSENWLGLYCDNNKVIKSGLWNRKEIEENSEIDFYFFEKLKHLINDMK